MRYALAMLAAVLVVDPLSAQQKPNIVLIVSDDQGWTDYGFMGHPYIRTPHLDKLASQSLVFHRGYRDERVLPQPGIDPHRPIAAPHPDL